MRASGYLTLCFDALLFGPQVNHPQPAGDVRERGALHFTATINKMACFRPRHQFMAL